MRLFNYMKPAVVSALSAALIKIYITFNRWTTKGGKRGFYGVVAHFADSCGVIRYLLINLPQLAGAHTSERIAEIINRTLTSYSISSSKLGYFVLNNATSNDTAIAALARQHGFDPLYQRLCCGPHTLNLVGWSIIFGSNKDA
jgi:hypothetical protein